MTVSSLSNKVTYIGDGAATLFSFSFALTSATDIQVFVTDSVGVVTTIPTNAYTVSLNVAIPPNPTGIGGSVLYPLTGPPLAIGNSITIARILPETQTVSISNQSIVYPPVVEQTFDRLIMVDQQVTENIGRAIVANIADPPMATLPPAAIRAGQLAVFDSAGNLTSGGPPTGVLISAAMTPVVTAATLPLAQAAMGVAPIASPVFTGNPIAPTPAPGDNDQSVATTAFVQAALVALGAIFSTGDLKPTHKTTADTGWILWIDGTVGDATSGSSVRANADTSALFTLYYNGYNDTNCPLLTSAGAITSRAIQGTAAVAFAAHCRMTLPKGSSRGLGLAGTGSGLTGRTLGSTFGVESVVMTISQMPSHNHAAATTGPHTHGHTWSNSIAEPNSPISQSAGGFNNISFSGTDAITGTDFSIATTDIGINVFNNGGSTPINVMNPMSYINIMIKL